jgi:hypothetical protein
MTQEPSPEGAPDEAGRTLQRKGQHLLAVAVLLGCGLLSILLWRQTWVLDDAYITYRYVANAVSDVGPYYNAGERVLGYSTALFFLSIQLLTRLGMEVEWAGRCVAFAGELLVPILLYFLLSRWSRWSVALLTAMVLAFHPAWVWAGHSGMETTLYVSCIFATALASTAPRQRGVGLFYGLTVLTRPDGIVLGALLPFLLRSWRIRWREAACFLLVVLAWAWYAWVQYGSVLPHSIEAKSVYHLTSHWEIFRAYWSAIVVEPAVDLFGVSWRPQILVAVLAALGVLFGWRRPGVALLSSYLVLNVSGYVASGIGQFNWYFVPLIAVAVALAGCGVSAVCRPERKVQVWGWGAVAALVVLLGSYPVLTHQRLTIQERKFARNYTPYQEISRWIRSNVTAGESILVGETGYMGFCLPGFRVIDSSGINSSEVQAIRASLPAPSQEDGQAFREREERALLEMVRAFEPVCVTTWTAVTGFREMMQSSWFKERYRLVQGPWSSGGKAMRLTVLWERKG